jgi:hypothetical protein
MEQEDKELLIKEISARLPYGVKLWTRFKDKKDPLDIFSINTRGWVSFWETNSQLDYLFVTDCRLYLRPLSSMTEEEKAEYEELEKQCESLPTFAYISVSKCILFDWLNAHHFDYRNLIEKRLALVAPDGMYNN